MPDPYLVCKRCVMDTSDPDIVFVEPGLCGHCAAYLAEYPALPAMREDWRTTLAELAARIKRDGSGKPYDCVIGLSGGLDSTYLAYVAVKTLGLRPIALHVDNGWNSELAVSNVEKTVAALGLDLRTVVLDWEEFRGLQLAFLKASTPDCEIPTDHAIATSMYRTAAEFGVRWILSGENFVTERIAPAAWSRGHADARYIRAVNRLHGTGRLRTFPIRTRLDELRWRHWNRIGWIKFFDRARFDPVDAVATVERELGWRAYPGKHYESTYTKFFQGYMLPRKFGFDKRRAHLSNLVCAGRLTREEALARLQLPAVDPDEERELLVYVAKKFKTTPEALDDILRAPPKTYWDYPNRYNAPLYLAVRAVWRRAIKPLLARGK
jgi:N-acetyl sugar amidotransferase